MTYLPSPEAVRRWMRNYAMDTVDVAFWINANYQPPNQRDLIREADIYNILAQADGVANDG